jgi:hypothetical protein
MLCRHTATPGTAGALHSSALLDALFAVLARIDVSICLVAAIHSSLPLLLLLLSLHGTGHA